MSAYDVDLLDVVPSTVPEAKYEHSVENILRDKADRWRHDYYSSTSTIYDVDHTTLLLSIRKTKAEISRCEKSLTDITQKIENSKLDPKHQKYVKLTAKDVEELEAEYIEIYKKKCDQMIALDSAQLEETKIGWKRYVEVTRYKLLNYVRNKFMIDGDQDFMTRGVTYVEKYIERQRLAGV
jgi:hypothetical protein